jgi:FkbM family methyltransferase
MEKLIKIVGILIGVIKNCGFWETLWIFVQLVSRKKEIRVRYRNNELFMNSEKAVFYHIAYSLEKLEKLANSIITNSCETVVDVGANCGIFSYFVGKRFPNANYFLFEPSKELNSIILQNLKGLKKLTIINKAVIDIKSAEYFYINKDSQETNTLYKESMYGFSKGKIRRRMVETTSLDIFAQARNLKKIDILKVDVQGAELRLIRGGERVLSTTREAFFETTFLFKNIVQILNYLTKEFKNYEVINEIIMGVDLHFYRTK